MPLCLIITNILMCYVSSFFSDNVKKLGGEYFHEWGCGGCISCLAQFSFPFEKEGGDENGESAKCSAMIQIRVAFML